MESSKSSISIFKEIEDPRLDRQKKYKLIDILLISLCGVICGADSWELIAGVDKAKYDWFKTFLELPHGIPSHDTFARVFSLINPDQFLDCFSR